MPNMCEECYMTEGKHKMDCSERYSRRRLTEPAEDLTEPDEGA